MSYYDEFNSKDDLINHIKEMEEPFCLCINYNSKNENYKFWSGNQPYEYYEKTIEDEEKRTSFHKKKLNEIKNEISLLIIKTIENNGQIDEKDLIKIYRKCEP